MLTLLQQLLLRPCLPLPMFAGGLLMNALAPLLTGTMVIMPGMPNLLMLLLCCCCSAEPALLLQVAC
jgi:hypothetical protein